MGQEESSKTFFVDVKADIVTTVAPDFKGMEYENGITTVKGILHTYVVGLGSTGKVVHEYGGSHTVRTLQKYT